MLALAVTTPALALDPARTPAAAPLPYGRDAAEAGSPFDRLDAQAGSATDAKAAGELARLKSALDALDAGRIAEARAFRDARPPQSLDHRIAAWAIASSRSREVQVADVEGARRLLAGWPVDETLALRLEQALERSSPTPKQIFAAFEGRSPQTADGAILLARAHLAMGDAEAAKAVILPLWHGGRMEARDELAIQAGFGALLSPADHRRRMEAMLYQDRIASAGRVAALAGAAELHAAWAAVIRNQAAAGALLDAVPEAQRGAGYVFARTRHLRRAGRLEEAAETIAAAPRDAASLIDPDAWWVERRALSRDLAEEDDAESAWRIAAAHAAESPASAADAEFHAGWFALATGEAGAAETHFARIGEIASGPISLARGAYWHGRALEASGRRDDAREKFRQAAAHESSFYGQIAAAKLGQPLRTPAMPVTSEEDRLGFESREAVHAVRRLEQAGDAARARTLTMALAEAIDGPGELALLAEGPASRGDHHLALRIAKRAAARGIPVGALAHPVGAIPRGAGVAPAGLALAYAVARQESEFNPGAVSPAGARGLLQLLPGTARDTARRLGLPWSQARLTGDPAYNAALGAAYLGRQLDRFGGSYVLTLAGYNAGPRRADQWVARFGDPRGRDLDAVVDWIERIPFAETRSYVQRVMENYQVYKLRLDEKADAAADLTSGRAMRR